MIISESEYLAHYGILRRSGRYPWGSSGWGKGGDKPDYPWSGAATVADRAKGFQDYFTEMKAKGLSEKEIADGVGMTLNELRATKTNAKNEYKASQVAQAQRLKDKGYSISAISERMNIPKPTVVSYLKPGADDRAQNLRAIRELLKEKVDDGSGYLDIGSGVSTQLGVSPEKLRAAVTALKDLGYEVHNVPRPQLTTSNDTTVQVLTKPGTTQKEAHANRLNVDQVFDHSVDGGRTFLGIHPPLSFDSKRLAINYEEDGGADMDGVIYVREGVKDVSLGNARYAQVRVLVDDTHFIKGMAIYKEGLPEGVDLVFNTNKSRKVVEEKGPLGALKEINDDPDNPFKTSIPPDGQVIDTSGKEPKVTSVMNRVYDEGDWVNWRDSLSPQVLSKQDPKLAKAQLDMLYERHKNELDEILTIKNSVVKEKLLKEFSDTVDGKMVDLKAAKMPGQAWQVILPINSLKDNEVYAPRYKDGEEVVLIRYPHGGTFEIPRLTVNNKNREANKIMGKEVRDAIGINTNVAARLSGADFDGDTVLVIPDPGGKIRTSPALEGLKNFDPVKAFPKYEGMPKISERHKNIQMGIVSNLITDMTLRGAPPEKLAAAVRHSMVIIDSEKHHLNYKESYRVNGIAALKAEFQAEHRDTGKAGSSTLISRAKSPQYVDKLEPRGYKDGGPIDKDTGKLVLVPSKKTKVDRKTGERVPRIEKRPLLSLVDDAYDLVSGKGTRMERVYADHSNKMRALANKARLEIVNSPVTKVTASPATKEAYKAEVASLKAKVIAVETGRPKERHAQTIAGTVYRAKVQSNPNMDDTTKKKVKAQALMEARIRLGLTKHPITITEREWEAVEAGAVANDTLRTLLAKTDMDEVRKLATPKKEVLMSSAKTKRAEQMMNMGYTRAEIAQHLGVSVSTLDRALYE